MSDRPENSAACCGCISEAVSTSGILAAADRGTKRQELTRQDAIFPDRLLQKDADIMNVPGGCVRVYATLIATSLLT